MRQPARGSYNPAQGKAQGMSSHTPAGAAGQEFGFGSFRAAEVPLSRAAGAARGAGEAGERGGLTELVGALARRYPGFRVVDRELELAPGRVVQLVAVDGLGALHLLVAAEDDELALLTIIDALLALETDREVLAEHCGASDCDLRLRGRVIAISERFSERFLLRTRALQGDGLDLLEVRELASAAGRRVHLIAPAVPGVGRAPGAPSSLVEFLARLNDRARGTAQEFIERVKRIDPSIEPRPDGGELRFMLGATCLAALRDQRGVLGARAGAATSRELVLHGTRELEQMLDEVVRGYVDHWGQAQASDERAEASDPAQGAPSAKPIARGVLSEPEESPVSRAFDPKTPILTPEEMEAFGRPL